MQLNLLIASLIPLLPIATSNPLVARTPLTPKGVFIGYTLPLCPDLSVPGVTGVQTYTKINRNTCTDIVPNSATPLNGFQSFKAGANPGTSDGKPCQFEIYTQAACAGGVQQTVDATLGSEATCQDFSNIEVLGVKVQGKSVKFVCATL